MKDSKLYRRVSTAGLTNDPLVRAQHPMMRQLWRVHVQSALRRDIVVEITIADYARVSQAVCKYCGTPPTNTTKFTGKSIVYNGVDRLDNAIGYTVDNIVACCKLCNAMKSGLAPEAFIEHVRRVASYQLGMTETTS